jgi:1-deoxy-D-xylulose-5-phosphate synthase
MTGHIRKAKSGIKQLFVPGMFFEDMGITYLGPVDGHDLRALCRVFKEAEKLENAVLVHVITTKGKGYLPAEKYPSKFHGTGPFDIETGQTRETSGEDSYTDVFSKVIYREAKKEPKLVAITAAMAGGTGLVPFSKTYRDRFFDVGIAEEHAVTFAAGLAAAGLKPVVAIYSSFLQRAYDQLIHDVCLQNLPVVFAIDRAGLVGSDGETHQGLFDLSFLSTIPNMTVMSPKNKWELADMLRFAIQYPGPVAVRYPRGTAYTGLEEFRAPIEYGKSEVIRKGSGVAIFSVGHMMETALQVCDALKTHGIDSTLVNSRFIKPVDEELLKELSASHTLYVTIEENVLTGGYGAQVLACIEKERISVRTESFGIPDEYVEHGSVDVLRKEVMLDADTVTERILSVYQGGQQE